MIRSFHRREDGFALVELLLSIAILGAILGTVYLAYFQSRRIFDGLSSSGKRTRGALAFVNQVRSDLSGITRQAVSIPSSSAESHEKKEGEEIILQFVSILERGAAPAPYWVTYFLRRESDKETWALYRRQASRTPQREPASTEGRLLKDVIGAKVESFMGREWKTGWPAAEVPGLLRLSLSFQEIGEETSIVSWIFELPVAKQDGGADGEPAEEKSEKAGEEGKKADEKDEKVERP